MNNPSKTGQAALSAHHIHKYFGNLCVLNDVSMRARRGDVITMIGASGSGKSTFLRCLNLLEVPTKGEIECGGQKIAIHNKGKLPSDTILASFRVKMGMVFQQFNLWPHYSALENVALPVRYALKKPKKEAQEIAAHYLDRVGLTQKKADYPAQLSGGQQQRVAIARALAMEPEVLLLDEPTSALDPELVKEVLSVMQSLAQEGRTMILVTHEMAFAREISTEILFLHNGRIEESGPPSRIFTAPSSARCAAFLDSIIKHDPTIN